jgi:DNA-3-methyladenine glycosylase I
MANGEVARCNWVGASPLMIQYHDEEWGVPLHDDQKLFEFLVLDGAQAGLSWDTILKRREHYRRAFDQFDVARVAAYTDGDVDRLLTDAGIIRNRRKIVSAVENARRVLEIQRELGSFDAYLWGFVGGQPVKNAFRALSEIPAVGASAEKLSRDMRRRGFSFVGPTICYAFMQAAGLVNDHLMTCFRYDQV